MTGHADLLFVLVGFVVEELELGLCGDGGVDFVLPGDARLPPCGVQLAGGFGPIGGGLTWDFPFLPGLGEEWC